jgi:hypothetical protein
VGRRGCTSLNWRSFLSFLQARRPSFTLVHPFLIFLPLLHHSGFVRHHLSTSNAISTSCPCVLQTFRNRIKDFGLGELALLKEYQLWTMAPRSSRASGADTDTSMADTSEAIRQLPVDPMVRKHDFTSATSSSAMHITLLTCNFHHLKFPELIHHRRLMRLRTTQKIQTQILIPLRAVLWVKP